jgi:acyl-CoA thioesterase-2
MRPRLAVSFESANVTPCTRVVPLPVLNRTGAGLPVSEELHALLGLLQVEQLDDCLFRGFSPPGRTRRVYGGQVLAQAMNAAMRTVGPGRRVHSQHAYFLRPGDPARPILYHVDPIRDGKRFSTRSVVARQAGKAIFNTSLSFQQPEAGLEHEQAMPAGVPPPESLESDFDYFTRIAREQPERFQAPRRRAVDHRPVERIDWAAPVKSTPHTGVWMRADGPLPEAPGIHEVLLAFLSDNYLMSTAIRPHGRGFDDARLQTASLDHGLWFYADFRADEWLYYHLASPRSAMGRGFNVGYVYTRDGRLVATAVQEGLMRLRGADES